MEWEKAKQIRKDLYAASCKSGVIESCDMEHFAFAPLYNIWEVNAHKIAQQEQDLQERLKELTQSYRESCGDDADIKALLNPSSAFTQKEVQKIAHSFVPSNYAPICVSLSHSLSALVQYNYRRKNPSPTGFKEAALANLSACLKANNLTSCLFAAELSKASGPDIQIFASPLDKNISLLASEYGIMLSQERLEDIASLILHKPSQRNKKESNFTLL